MVRTRSASSPALEYVAATVFHLLKPPWLTQLYHHVYIHTHRDSSMKASQCLHERWDDEEEEPHNWRVNGWLRERLTTAMELA